MSATDWEPHRIHNAQNQCACNHCCKSSNICAQCRNWAEIVNFQCYNAPFLRCTQCRNCYHLGCLPARARIANSWQQCSDIGESYSCSTRRHFFSFLKVAHSSPELEKNEKLIMEKYHKIYPNRQCTISAHFNGFHLNGHTLTRFDCVQISVSNDEEPSIAHIMDIVATRQNDALLLVQWYYHRRHIVGECTGDEAKRLFFNNGPTVKLDVVEMDCVLGRVRVLDSLQECKQHTLKLQRLQKKKKEEIAALKQTLSPSEFRGVCLAEKAPSYKAIRMDAVYYCTDRCMGRIQIFSMYEDDKDAARRKRQIQLLRSHEKLKKERKREKMRCIAHEQTNDVGQNSRNSPIKKRNADQEINYKKYAKLEDTNNHRKRKHRDFDEQSSDEIPIQDLYPIASNKRRKLQQSSDELLSANFYALNQRNQQNRNYHSGRNHNDQQEQDDETTVRITREQHDEYLALKRTTATMTELNEKQLQENNAQRIEIEKLRKEIESANQRVNQYKKFEDEILILQKSKSNAVAQLQQFRMNEQKYKEEREEFQQKYRKLEEEGRKNIEKYKKKIIKLKKEHDRELKNKQQQIGKLHKAVQVKDENIKFYKKLCDAQNVNTAQQTQQNSNNSNHEDIAKTTNKPNGIDTGYANDNIVFHISDIPQSPERSAGQQIQTSLLQEVHMPVDPRRNRISPLNIQPQEQQQTLVPQSLSDLSPFG